MMQEQYSIQLTKDEIISLYALLIYIEQYENSDCTEIKRKIEHHVFQVSTIDELEKIRNAADFDRIWRKS